MSVHYKFRNSVDHDIVHFDGVNISVADFKKAIMQQKRLSSADCDYQITDAKTKEVYTNDKFIPKNTSVLVARIPLEQKQRRNYNDKPDPNMLASQEPAGHQHADFDNITRSSDFSRFETEEEAIRAAVSQSTVTTDPSRFVRVRGMAGPLHPGYRCFRCGQSGHHIKNCPQNSGNDVKRSTGIPRSFIIPCEANEKGAYKTPDGGYGRPIVEAEAYTEVRKEKPPVVDEALGSQEPEVNIPSNLQCVLCHGLLRDAVFLSCCVASCCDDCIRTALIESDDHQCPVCQEIGVSPDTLVPCIKLRKEVIEFVNLSNPLWPKDAPSQPDPSPEQQQQQQQVTAHASPKTDHMNGSSPGQPTSSGGHDQVPSPPSQPLDPNEKNGHVPNETEKEKSESAPEAESDNSNHVADHADPYEQAAPIQNLIRPTSGLHRGHGMPPYMPGSRPPYRMPQHDGYYQPRPGYPPYGRGGRLPPPYPYGPPVMHGYGDGYYPPPRMHHPPMHMGYDQTMPPDDRHRYPTHNRYMESSSYDEALERFHRDLESPRYPRSRSPNQRPRSRSRSRERRRPYSPADRRRSSRSPLRNRGHRSSPPPAHRSPHRSPQRSPPRHMIRSRSPPHSSLVRRHEPRHELRYERSDPVDPIREPELKIHKEKEREKEKDRGKSREEVTVMDKERDRDKEKEHKDRDKEHKDKDKAHKDKDKDKEYKDKEKEHKDKEKDKEKKEERKKKKDKKHKSKDKDKSKDKSKKDRKESSHHHEKSKDGKSSRSKSSRRDKDNRKESKSSEKKSEKVASAIVSSGGEDELVNREK